jgi:hypothetical protein
MAENYTIIEIPVNRVLNLQTISPQDDNLLTEFNVEGYLSPTGSNVEFSIYDLNNNLLSYNPNYIGWKGTTSGTDSKNKDFNSISIDPGQDVNNSGYGYGQVYTVYNFLKNEIGSSYLNQFFISEISSDRTEIRIDNINISNESLEILFDEFYTKFNLSENYDYFYLNFGDNNLLISTNLYLDKSTDNYSVLIKLYDALPQQFGLKSQCFVSSIEADSIAYQVSFQSDIINIDTILNLQGPNTNLNINNQVNNSTNLQNYQSLTQNVYTSSVDQLKSLLNERGLEINVDYEDYYSFVFFSSAQSRLENFYYKAKQIENYNNDINTLNSLTSTPGSSGSISILEQYISNIITNFDGYEYYLYFESGSKAWPKTNSTPPYTLASTGSAAVLSWYGSQLIAASLYDEDNQNLLVNTIPDYLKDYDSENYLTFVKMIGQSFDSIWVYIKNISEKTNTDNRLYKGAPVGLLADILRSFGVKIYTNNFSVDDTYQSLLGIGADGQLYPTGSELINTLITASTIPITLDDVQNLTYKRLYHNLPYLLKKKGTIDGIRTLSNAFGVDDTILRINEFGGKDKNFNTWDYWQDEFSYAFYTSGSTFMTSSFTLNSNWSAGNDKPDAIEFRFKTDGLPYNTASIASQSLFTSDTGLTLRLRYTGSGYTSGSYSGSIIDPYYQYSLLEFIPDPSNPQTSASVYLPFYDGNWWSVLINRLNVSPNYEIYAKSKNYTGDDGNTIGFQASSSVTALTDNPWINSINVFFGSSSLFGKAFTGSYQEVRYYSRPISESTFNAYVMNPNSIEQSEYLAFRATLGGELYTASVSVHPKVNGPWVTTSSFISNSNFYFNSNPLYVPNVEVNFYDQPAVGIQNPVSAKIQNQRIILPYGEPVNNIPDNKTLSLYKTIQQNPPISSSYTNDVNYVEVAYSPQNEINEDIMDSLGFFNIGELIGDPRLVPSSAESYPALDALRNLYFEKYSSNYDWNDYIRLIKFFDNSFFKMLKDYLPSKASIASGVVIKQHILERNKYPVPQMSFTQQEYTGSIDMYEITGSDGGGLNVTPIVTQSWTGTTTSIYGPVPFTQNDEAEFYNGELSGSFIEVTNGQLSDCNVELIQVYTTSSIPTPTYLQVEYTFKEYDFDVDKTYYLSFTVNNPGSFQGGIRIFSLINGTVVPIYSISNLNGGDSISIDKLEISNTLGSGAANFSVPLYFGNNDVLTNCTLTNFTIYEAYTEPDCLVIAGNVLDNRPNPYFIDVDYSTSQNLAINLQSILSGSGTRFPIPESNYTSKRSANPRYFGSKYVGQYNYSSSFASSSVPTGYPIDNFANYFMYFDWIGPANPEYPGGGSVHGIYLIDIEGNAIPLTQNNYNLFITENTFVGGQTANILPAVYSSGKKSLTVNIVDGGTYYDTIILTTGSQNPWINSSTDQGTSQGFGLYFNSSSLNILNDSRSLDDFNTSWIYSLSNPSSSTGIIEFFYFSGFKGVSIMNKYTGQYVNDNSTEPIINYTDTYLPLQYGDIIRFGTTSSYSNTNTSSLDGTFTGGGIFQISKIITGSNNDVSSSIFINSLISNYPFTQNIALPSLPNQNFRIIRRVPSENFVMIQNLQEYKDPGFLVPFNFNPKYNVYDLAKKAGIIQ